MKEVLSDVRDKHVCIESVERMFECVRCTYTWLGYMKGGTVFLLWFFCVENFFLKA